MTPKEKTKWLTREVFGFGLTSFFSDLSHEIATTLLPLFLASLGAPAYAVGFIEGAADGLSGFTKLLGGWVSDRTGKRKSLALIGYAVTGITQGLFAFAAHWSQVFIFRVSGWMGRGFRSPIRDALFHDSVPKEASGRAFGFERALDTLGAVIAPVLAYFFAARLGFRQLFLLTWIPGILAVLTFFLFIKEKKIERGQSFSLLKGIGRFSPRTRRFLFAVTLFGLGDFSHTLLIYWAGVLLTPVYGAARASGTAILFYALHNFVYAAASYPMGRLADKIGKIRVLAAGYFLAGLTFLALAFTRGQPVFLGAIFFLSGFYIAIEDSLERAVAGDLLAKEIKATGYGVLASLNGIGDLFSSFIVGLLLSFGSPLMAFGYCFVLSLAGAFFLSAIQE